MLVKPLAFAQLFASADVVVDFDPTFLVQLVLFAAFFLVLKPLLFEPLLRVFEEREKRTDGAKKEAREMDLKAGDIGARYEAELEKVRRAAGLEREKVRQEVARLEAQIMAEARAETTRILDEGKKKIEAEIATLRSDVDQQIPELAGQIASRVLGREVRPS
jgi:F-type H+-transporting ATPase subunit b